MWQALANGSAATIAAAPYALTDTDWTWTAVVVAGALAAANADT